MRCSRCGHEDTKVLESRLSLEGRSVRRRRSCIQCNHRFTTYEKEEELQFQVRKKDGRFEAYQRDKVFKSLQIACQKRPITIEQLEGMVDRVEKSLQEEGERSIDSNRIGDLIMNNLRAIDHVAYVRFASVYKDFKDPDEFLKELEELRNDANEENLHS